MSFWTEIIIAAASIEDTSQDDEPDVFPAIDHLNAWLEANNQPRLFHIVPSDPAQHRPDACFATATKRFNEAEFMAAVRAAPWQWPEQVQVMIRQEDDRGFRFLPHA